MYMIKRTWYNYIVTCIIINCMLTIIVILYSVPDQISGCTDIYDAYYTSIIIIINQTNKKHQKHTNTLPYINYSLYKVYRPITNLRFN